MLPDVIYTQNPYDECNYTTSVHPFFYARNLKKYTDKLVYIPWFTMRDVNVDNGKVNQTMKYFCTVPGVVLADEVWMPSESAKEAYVRKLTAFAGEDTKCVWEDKIHVHEVPVCSLDYSNIFENCQLRGSKSYSREIQYESRSYYMIYLRQPLFREGSLHCRN